MKKLLFLLLAALMVFSLMSVTAFAELDDDFDVEVDVYDVDLDDDDVDDFIYLDDWAYAGITVDSEDYGISSIYYTDDFYDDEDIINPITVQPYTDVEIADIISGAVVGADDYVVYVPDSAYIGVSVYGPDGQILWFDEDTAQLILTYTEPLYLDVEIWALVDSTGKIVANAIPVLENWAFAGITIDSKDLGIGSVYYCEDYYRLILNGELDTINPRTQKPYTAEGIQAILSGAVVGARGYVTGVPAEGWIGISVFDSNVIYWYDADNSSKILSSTDPLSLNATTGELSTLAGESVAVALKTK